VNDFTKVEHIIDSDNKHFSTRTMVVFKMFLFCCFVFGAHIHHRFSLIRINLFSRIIVPSIRPKVICKNETKDTFFLPFNSTNLISTTTPIYRWSCSICSFLVVLRILCHLILYISERIVWFCVLKKLVNFFSLF
jgi:hypothetical protein